jgi:perosamine synthetase
MIPVYEPLIGEEEIQAVVSALKNGELSGTFGENIPRFEEEFAAYCGCRFGVATNSGTTALHLAIAAAGIKAGEEVLVSAMTNIATALAPVYAGAVPVPVDSEMKTWNMDLNRIDKLITPKTKAIIPVHVYGHPVDMDHLNKIAEKYGLMVIEDCAEAHGAECRGKKVGGFGDMACFSFYANKVITTGEGGIVITNNESLAEKMRLLRNLAFTKPRFRHEEIGFNYRMTGYQAAMGREQLKKIDWIIEQKRCIAKSYNKYLKDCPGIQLPFEEKWAKNVYWMYGIVIHDDYGMNRDELAEYLHREGIQTRTFFCPMNIQPAFEKLKGFPKISCPVSESLWEKGLYLPASLTLTDSDIEYISGFIRNAGKK